MGPGSSLPPPPRGEDDARSRSRGSLKILDGIWGHSEMVGLGSSVDERTRMNMLSLAY
jgi:hypothetical protein